MNCYRKDRAIICHVICVLSVRCEKKICECVDSETIIAIFDCKQLHCAIVPFWIQFSSYFSAKANYRESAYISKSWNMFTSRKFVENCRDVSTIRVLSDEGSKTDQSLVPWVQTVLWHCSRDLVSWTVRFYPQHVFFRHSVLFQSVVPAVDNLIAKKSSGWQPQCLCDDNWKLIPLT